MLSRNESADTLTTTNCCKSSITHWSHSPDYSPTQDNNSLVMACAGMVDGWGFPNLSAARNLCETKIMMLSFATHNHTHSQTVQTTPNWKFATTLRRPHFVFFFFFGRSAFCVTDDIGDSIILFSFRCVVVCLCKFQNALIWDNMNNRQWHRERIQFPAINRTSSLSPLLAFFFFFYYSSS